MNFYRFCGRLAQFDFLQDHQSFWEELWSKHQIQKVLKDYQQGKLEEFGDLFLRYLPKDKPVLEAGCGMSQLVMALSARGYHVEGIDYAAQTIAAVKASFPALNLRVGDIYDIDTADKYYGAYISIGLFEHSAEGPEKGLKEAWRVLRDDGMAFISVPYLNLERDQLLRKVPHIEKTEDSHGDQFFQYYFSHKEFKDFLKKTGFEIVEVLPYAVYSGLTRDFKFGQWLHARKFFFWHVERSVTRWCREAPLWARWRWAHMLMFVCKKRP